MWRSKHSCAAVLLAIICAAIFGWLTHPSCPTTELTADLATRLDRGDLAVLGTSGVSKDPTSRIIPRAPDQLRKTPLPHRFGFGRDRGEEQPALWIVQKHERARFIPPAAEALMSRCPPDPPTRQRAPSETAPNGAAARRRRDAGSLCSGASRIIRPPWSATTNQAVSRGRDVV